MTNFTLKGGWGHLMSPSRSKQVQKWLREQENTQDGLTWKQFTKTPTTLDVHHILFGGHGVGLGHTHTHKLKYTITISTNNYSEESTTKQKANNDQKPPSKVSHRTATQTCLIASPHQPDTCTQTSSWRNNASSVKRASFTLPNNL